MNNNEQVRESGRNKKVDIIRLHGYCSLMKMPFLEYKERRPDHARCSIIIRNARQNAGMSLRTLAAKMEISAPYLSDLELGRRAWNEAKFNQAWHFIKEGI